MTWNPNQPRKPKGTSSGGEWTGEGYHGTSAENLESILKGGIRTNKATRKVFVGKDSGTAAAFSGWRKGDAVVVKFDVPAPVRAKFREYVSASPNASGALMGSVKIQPGWIKAWAKVDAGGDYLGLGKWTTMSKLTIPPKLKPKAAR